MTQILAYESQVDRVMALYKNQGNDSINDYIIHSILDPHARYKDEQENE